MAWILVDTRVCVWWTVLANVKKIPYNKESFENIRKWQQTLRSWKKSWNLKSSKEYKRCLFSLFTLSLTIRMQIGECLQARGSLFCSVTMHVIPYYNIWTPDQSSMEVDYAFRKQHTIQSAILYSHTHPQCITSLGYTGNPIYNH